MDSNKIVVRSRDGRFLESPAVLAFRLSLFSWAPCFDNKFDAIHKVAVTRSGNILNRKASTGVLPSFSSSSGPESAIKGSSYKVIDGSDSHGPSGGSLFGRIARPEGSTGATGGALFCPC